MRKCLKNEPEQSIFDVVKRAAWEAAWEAEKIGVSKAVGLTPALTASAISTSFAYFFPLIWVPDVIFPGNLHSVGASALETEITRWPLQWPTASSFPALLRVGETGAEGTSAKLFLPLTQ